MALRSQDVEEGVGCKAWRLGGQGCGPQRFSGLLKQAPVGKEKLRSERLDWTGLFWSDLFSPSK